MSDFEKVIDCRIPKLIMLVMIILFVCAGGLLIYGLLVQQSSYGFTCLEHITLENMIYCFLGLVFIIICLAGVVLFSIQLKNSFSLKNNRIVFKEYSIIVPHGTLNNHELEIEYTDVIKVVDLKMNRFNSILSVDHLHGGFRLVKLFIGRKAYDELVKSFNEKIGDRFEYKNLGRWPQ